MYKQHILCVYVQIFKPFESMLYLASFGYVVILWLVDILLPESWVM